MGAVSEGYIDVPGGRVWYRDVGDADATPLLCLHGGPGSTHHKLEPLEALADRRRSHLEEMHRRMPGSQLAIIEDASHLGFAEQPAEFTALVHDFFDRTGTGSSLRPTARP